MATHNLGDVTIHITRFHAMGVPMVKEARRHHFPGARNLDRTLFYVDPDADLLARVRSPARIKTITKPGTLTQLLDTIDNL